MDQTKPEAVKAKTWGEFAVETANNPWVEGVAGAVAIGAVIASRGKLYSAAEKFLPKAFSITGEATESALPVVEKVGANPLAAQIAADSGKSMVPVKTFVPAEAGVPGSGGSLADAPKVLEPSDIWTPSRIPLRGALGPQGPHVVFIPTETVEAGRELGLGATGGPDFAKLAGKCLAPGTDIEAIRPATGTSAAVLGGRLGIESAVGGKAKTPSFYYFDEKKIPGT